MKKFRSATAAALALTSALALSACTPPNENDGDKREDTATTGPATPSIQSTEEAATDSGEAKASESAQSEETEATETEATESEATEIEATGAGAANTAATN